MVSRAGQQAAPGELERVRELLNTWLIPNDTRRAVDHLFDDYMGRHHLLLDEAVTLRALRDDLRAAIEAAPRSDEPLNRWIGRLRIRPVVRSGALDFEHSAGAAGDVVAEVLRAIASGTWSRLKACPDCRWVFYDHTRNGSKRWCLMYAGGPGGRACGTIAKVRRHRQRQRSRQIAPPGGASR